MLRGACRSVLHVPANVSPLLLLCTYSVCLSAHLQAVGQQGSNRYAASRASVLDGSSARLPIHESQDFFTLTCSLARLLSFE